MTDSRLALLLLTVTVLLAPGTRAAAGDDPADAEKWDVETYHSEVSELDFEATEGTWMSVDMSPDGESLVFDLLGHLYEMPAAGGEAKALTSGRSWNMYPRYSPDGRHIAFTSDRDGTDNLWLLDRDGGEPENISKMSDPTFRPTWSADGRQLFGTTQEENAGSRALAFNLHGSHQELHKGGLFRPINLLIDDAERGKIYFEQIDARLWASGARIKVFDRRTGKVSVYIERPGGAFNPALSPDGAHLAYLHREPDLDTVLVVRRLDTHVERVLRRDLDRDLQGSSSHHYGSYPNMTWNADGGEILIGTGGKIRAIDVETGNVRVIPFRVRVERRIDKTIRFRVEIPEGEAQTRLHRWSQRTDRGVLFEALGDFHLKNGGPTNLTRSSDHETSPVYDEATATLYYAAWNDDDLGAVYRLRLDGGTPEKLTSLPSQYGSLALAPDGNALAYLRGSGEIRTGRRLEEQATFELVVLVDGEEHDVTDITWTQNFAAKHPPAVAFGPEGEYLYFNEFDAKGEGPERKETLALKKIRRDGLDETTLYHFPHAVHAMPSPDLRWIAFREYHRAYVTPFDYLGKTVTVNAHDKQGTARRVDPDDGAFLTWSADSKVLAWTRGSVFYEKDVEEIMREGQDEDEDEEESKEKSTVRRTELALRFNVDVPDSTLALRGVRVVTINGEREVLEDATVLVKGHRVTALGRDVEVPSGAKVFDLAGHTIIPGFVDSHAHPATEASALNVIEERISGLRASLAHGVTTSYEVYGNPAHKDFWISDMERAGALTSPRLFSVGSPIYGQREFRPKLYRPITSLEDAREVVRYNRDHGATGVKDYAYFHRKARHLLNIAAREMGINVYAETAAIPAMNWTQVVDGETGLEHTPGLTPLYKDVVRLLAASEVGITPTLLVVYNGPTGESYFHQTERVWENEKLLRFVRAEDLMYLRRPTFYWPDDLYAPRMAREMKKLYDAGVSIQMGAHGQMLGLDAHWELELFVAGGFSPYEALEIATLNGARYHGLDAQVGSLEPGKLADLVVLRENPLEDIRNTRSVVYVMKNGVLYSGEDAARVYPDPQPAGKMYFH